MEKYIILFLVAIATVQAHEDSIRVYEIRKDGNVDDVNNNPQWLTNYKAQHEKLINGLLEQVKELVRNKIRNNREEEAERLLAGLAKLVSRVANKKTKIVDDVSKQIQSHQPSVLGKLLSAALRSEYEGVEDRTAPPRHRRPYDDYNDD
ncbi:unnamed protein product [Leptidea sinapis]|uniref:SXP/RAL-2 family protein Ani s 5-like cation-binding domain-containing protein n=1 Tax=Leptidea sinapis TaxID=189913 RepID=A0A5E4PMN6_9NEOP|nr:unnamed protein product [Leptidea sinapis]